ncbi:MULTISPECIES: hypothetical protein [unclassified Frankia]
MEADQRAAERALEKATRRVAQGGVPPDPVWKAGIEADAAQRAAEIDYWKRNVAEQEAAGVKVWRPTDFQQGDRVRSSFGWHTVLRVNKQSLTIPHVFIPGETWRLSYDQVLDRRVSVVPHLEVARDQLLRRQ